MTWAAIAVGVVFFMGTFMSFSNAFGIMTDCTDEYDCGTSGCAPCSTAGTWVDGGWIAQGVILFAAIGLLVVAFRSWRPRLVIALSVVAIVLSLVTWNVTRAEAENSFCQPGEAINSYC